MDNQEQNLSEKKERAILSYFKPILWIWAIFILGWIAVIGLFVAINNGLFGELPSSKKLEDPSNSLATEVYYSDNTLMGKYYIEDRTNVTYEEIPEELINTLVATEDERFYSHSGIDLYGLGSAVYRYVSSFGERKAGASTISQQLAKNLLHERASGIIDRIKQKLQEWVIAIKLERQYTKQEILTMYLNTVHFSHNVFGIKSAAKTYFSKHTHELTYNDSAFLIGMLKASTAFNPKTNRDRAFGRKNVVLGQVLKAGHFSETVKDSLATLEYDASKYNLSNHRSGNGTYFREYLREFLKQWAKENKKLDGSSYDIHEDGLKVYTTIDPNLQRYAEQAVAEYMPELQEQFYKEWKYKEPWHENEKAFLTRAMKRTERYRVLKRVNDWPIDKIEENFNTPRQMTVFTWNGETDTLLSPMDSIKHYKKILRSGLMAMDPASGFIKAWVGGINFNHFQYDNVRESSKRQVGSTFKPFIYTLAIQNGWSPCHKVMNTPVTIPAGKHGVSEDWTPRGSHSSDLDGKMLSLKTSLANSLNWVTAYLMDLIGPKPIVQMAKRMGVKSEIPEVASIALGAADISLYEMVGAYSTFANKGTYTQPLFITRIEDKNGQIIQDFVPQRNEALGEQHAYIMLNLMKGVKDEGTAKRLMYKYGFTLDQDIAGKTGTTNDNSDGWFIGIVPNLVTGIWTGGDEKVIRFKSTRYGQGANMALPIWAIFMSKIYEDENNGIKKSDTFEKPNGRISIELDCSKYDQYTDPLDNLTEENDSTNLQFDPQIEAEEDEFF